MKTEVLSARLYNRALKEAKSLALVAGDVMMKQLGRAKKTFKGKRDLVTEVDRWIEDYYKRKLYSEFPGFGYLAEEDNKSIPEEDLFWVIDPLDGTNNYTHQFPFFCTSIALTYKGNTLFGIVYDPVRKEMFWADKNNAYVNNKKISVSSIKTLEEGLVCTGFAYRFDNIKDNNLDSFIKLLFASQGIRRTGSAALDLAYISCGRLDAFWELHLKPWDTAAASYIIKRAGGFVTKIDGTSFDIFYPEIVATNKKLHHQVLRALTRKGVNVEIDYKKYSR